MANRVLTDTIEGHIGVINIDLEGANLKDFMLRGCTINRLRLRKAELYQSSETGPEFTLNDVRLQRAADFTAVVFHAEVVQFRDCTFHDGAVFRSGTLAGRTVFVNSKFEGSLDLSQTILDGQVYLDFATLKNFSDVWQVSKGLALTGIVPVNLGGAKENRLLIPNTWSIDRRDDKELFILNHY